VIRRILLFTQDQGSDVLDSRAIRKSCFSLHFLTLFYMLFFLGSPLIDIQLRLQIAAESEEFVATDRIQSVTGAVENESAATQIPIEPGRNRKLPVQMEVQHNRTEKRPLASFVRQFRLLSE